MFAGSFMRAGTARTVVVCLLLAGASRAAAQVRRPDPREGAEEANTDVEGAVVAVEQDDVIVDLGSLRGARDGEEVALWRALRVRHPVTGRVLVDRFRVGQMRLVQVRPNLSLALPQGTLAHPAQAGDVVVLSRGPAALARPVDSARAGEAPSARVSQVEDEGRELSRLFDGLRGSDPETRVRAYEAFAESHVHGRYEQVLREEARTLRELLATPGAPPSPDAPSSNASSSNSPAAQAQPFRAVVAAEPLRVAVTVQHARGAVLHARTAGEETYTSQPMQRAGIDYYAATINAERVRVPALEWFVEAVGDEGTKPVIGDPSTPERAAVEEVKPRPPRALLAQAALWTDYASFDARRNDDYVFQAEGVVGARLGDIGVRAVRTGFGVYRGVGGTLQRLDVQHLAGTPVGLTYGYLETELGALRTFSVVLRGIVGLQQDGVDGGASAFVRIGSDLATNLLVGGEVLGGIGLRGIAEFDWNSLRDWPVVIRSEVTNQPAGFDGDVGVRIIGQVGYRVLPRMVASLRASYQGRTIDHAGPGAGAAVGYSW
jgi:hypothetical protein